MPCPHENIVHCPLYVAAHDASLAPLTCIKGDWEEGCAVARDKLDYTKAVGRLRARAPRIVAECEFRQEADRIREQQRRNMRAAGLN